MKGPFPFLTPDEVAEWARAWFETLAAHGVELGTITRDEFLQGAEDRDNQRTPQDSALSIAVARRLILLGPEPPSSGSELSLSDPRIRYSPLFESGSDLIRLNVRESEDSDVTIAALSFETTAEFLAWRERHPDAAITLVTVI